MYTESILIQQEREVLHRLSEELSDDKFIQACDVLTSLSVLTYKYHTVSEIVKDIKELLK